jgi:hypothetical protein
VLEVPLSSGTAARCLRALLEHPAIPMLREIVSLEVGEDRARLRFPPRLLLYEQTHESWRASDGGLRKLFVERGYAFDGAPSLAEIRRLLDAPR